MKAPQIPYSILQIPRVVVCCAIAVFAMPSIAHAASSAVKPSAPSSFVLDLTTNAVTRSERAEVVRPIASLTKLMTAMVVLDTRVSLDRSIAYDPARHYAYRNWTNFRRGDRLSGQSLLHLTLTGSQNITARMLVALAGLSEREAVRRMNVKAASLGLARSRFVDVHGLHPGNVSTAAEVARVLEVALTYPDIVAALRKPEMTVTITPARGAPRALMFAHTNPLLAQWQRFATEASKTGYLDEAGDALAMRIRDPEDGRRYLVVTLGEHRRSPRFPIAKRLAEAAVATQRIAGISSE